MSDYFGALLRAAGAVAARPTGRDGTAVVAAGTVGGAAGDDIVEQAVEVEAGARGERVAVPVGPSPEPVPEPAVRRAAAAAGGPPDRPPGARPEPAGAAPPAATPDVRAAAFPATPAPVRPPGDDPALAHPLVQAALRWVAADPQAVPAADPRPATGDGLPRPAIRPGAADRPAPDPAPAGPRPAIVGRSEAAQPLHAAPEIDLALPVAPRPRPPSAAERAEARVAFAARPIDVHIGTIHVAVDAPPRAAVAPAVAPAPPARTEAPRPAATAASGFARLRLPRL